jgi:hypothetical protein
MKKYTFYFLLVICTSFFLTSCKDSVADITLANQETTLAVSPTTRLELMKIQDMNVLKTTYRVLSQDKQKEFWLDKLRQVESQKLSSEQIVLIKELEVELSRSGSIFAKENAKVKQIGLSLASITPKEDFIRMFATLDDYRFDPSNSHTDICSECISDMLSDTTIATVTTNSPTLRVNECNCRWTCDWGTGCSTGLCAGTGSGCGFLWLGSCGRRAIIC